MKNNLKIGAIYVNVYSQEVEITDVDIQADCVVFVDINNDSADTLRVEEFQKIFKPLERNKSEFTEPTKREFQKMIL